MIRLLLIGGVILIAIQALPAGAAAESNNSLTPHQKSSPAILGTLWDVPKLYTNKNNPYIQSFSLVGRYHGQYWSVESAGVKEDGWSLITGVRLYF